jgi:hypothetical protein
MKLLAAAGALALVSAVPAAAEAATRIPYAVGASQNAYNVTCAAGASAGTAPVKLRVTRNTSRVTPAELGDTDGRTNRWVATWPGGSGSITIKSTGLFYSASRGATFPCPTTSAETGRFTITVQSFFGSQTNGNPAHYNVLTRRVGSASGIAAVGVNGAGVFTTVLGERLVAPDGPAPVGGVQTGAGGTSQRTNNLLLPLGAGLGFAGLASALMIRRRRCPAQ